MFRRLKIISLFGVLLGGALAVYVQPRTAGAGGEQSPTISAFLEEHCLACHNGAARKGNLDLTALKLDLAAAPGLADWIKIHDRVEAGEMPPKGAPRPDDAARAAFLKSLSGVLRKADAELIRREGRSVWRRMNRYEYENTLRDLFGAPWLDIREMLPEDGVAHRFNKSGEALSVSHVQMSRYLTAAEYALREVLATASAPSSQVKRYYARDQHGFTSHVEFSQFNTASERATFPMLGNAADVAVLKREAPMTAGAADPAKREQESMGVVAGSYEPLEIRFDHFRAPASGRYKLRLNANSFWAEPESAERWWRPSRDRLSAGRTIEPVTLYAEIPPRQVRRLGSFDVRPEPTLNEVDVYLLKGETIRPDAARLFRSRPPNWRNPLAQRDGQPGVAFRWLEVEGPIPEEPIAQGRRLLVGDLPLKKGKSGMEVVSANPRADAEKLLRGFLARAYRRPVVEDDVLQFLKPAETALKTGVGFTEAMITAYSAVLCSPAFVTLEEKPGVLDDDALATRLSYFLWNSEPDVKLRELARQGMLRRPAVLRAQAERLLADPKARRFINSFLDYWLDLRKINQTSPDENLYPDYYLDDYLAESALGETQGFFAELLRHDLPARNLVASDFVWINERLATHYGIAGVQGAALRRVALSADSSRGGLLTQAGVLKVTANGTTTSPVLRGVWITERLLGRTVPPPPPSVPAVEPDTRGATTIRALLDKHRTQPSCNACHARIDPPGFALENFDVMGGWRDKYRALGGAADRAPGIGKNGQRFAFSYLLPVDASGALPDGRQFQDVRELKRLLLADERQIARNLMQQLIVFATGAPVRFSDRPKVEAMLDRAARRGYGVKSIIQSIVESELFRSK